MKLELMHLECRNLIDKFMLGCILFAIYGRCRWSDLESVNSLEFDIVDTPEGGKFGFVEMRTRVHKTGGTEERKAMFMPYVAPICGVCNPPWAREWKDTMEKLEIDLTVKNFGAICRAPRSDSGFTKRPITTEEITNMLNKFLGSACRTTSHSMKTTLLTWSARYGMDEKTRTLLGHHSLREDSLACYSRDLMANPMKQLAGMLLNVREGRFRRDVTRSGWMSTDQVPLKVFAGRNGLATPGTETQPAAQSVSEHQSEQEVREEVLDDWEKVSLLHLDEIDSQVVPSELPEPGVPVVNFDEPERPHHFLQALKSEPQAENFQFEISDDTKLSELQNALENMYEHTHAGEGVEDILESDSSSEESSVDSSSDSDEEDFHASQTDRDTYPEITVIPGDLLQNKKSRMLHRVSPGTEVSQCGVHGPNFKRLPDGSKFWWPRCNKCFKGDLADTEEKAIAILDRAKKRWLSQ